MPDIEFGQLQADLPTYQNTGAIKVDNVIPLSKGYRSFPSFAALSGTGLNTTPVGLFTSFSDGGSTNYAGDDPKQVDIVILPQKDQETFGHLRNLVKILLPLIMLIIYKNLNKELTVYFQI